MEMPFKSTDEITAMAALCFAGEELHKLIGTVVVNWNAEAKVHELELRGKLLTMLDIKKSALGTGLDISESSLKLVAGVGFEPTTFRL